LKTKSKLLQAKSSDGSTPLHIAAKYGSVKSTQLLLDSGADANALNKLKDTPIHFAAMAGHSEVAALLLLKGADPKLPNLNLQTPETLDAFNVLNSRGGGGGGSDIDKSKNRRSMFAPRSLSRNSLSSKRLSINEVIKPDLTASSGSNSSSSSSNNSSGNLIKRMTPSAPLPALPPSVKQTNSSGKLASSPASLSSSSQLNATQTNNKKSVASSDLYNTDCYAESETLGNSSASIAATTASKDLYHTDAYAEPSFSLPKPAPKTGAEQKQAQHKTAPMQQSKQQPTKQIDLYSTDAYSTPELAAVGPPSGKGESVDLYATDLYATDVYATAAESTATTVKKTTDNNSTSSKDVYSTKPAGPSPTPPTTGESPFIITYLRLPLINYAFVL